MKLRRYQADLKQSIYDAWSAGSPNVLAVMPTGAGKTVVGSDIILEADAPTCSIAHRQELVTQISLALARDGVRHRIIGPEKVVKLAAGQHMAELGRNYIDPNSRNAVAGVDTLIRRAGSGKDGDYWVTKDPNNPSALLLYGPRTGGMWGQPQKINEPPQNLKIQKLRPVDADPSIYRWAQSVRLWWTDEAHHLLIDNKWGAAAQMFPNACGLGVTATPTRADGAGLGRHADGLFDHMVEGPTMRDLIGWGFLTDYRIFAPPSDLDLSGVSISTTTGDYSKPGVVKAIKKSHVVGDVVAHYLRIARGKLGITFATDVETATEIAEQFNAAGVPAAVVSAKTPDAERIKVIQRFKRRELLQLVNVDLFGEGFDLPAIEVVSMARPTQSFALYAQQFGRALRIMDGKTIAIIIDHVGNVVRHGLPDAPRVWTLDRRERRGKGTADDVIPVTACIQCTAVYERVHNACPFCGHKPEPQSRGGPEFVDGDLAELDPATLAQMRGEIARIDGPVQYPQGLPQHARIRLDRIHRERQQIQQALRTSIAWWTQHHTDRGCSVSETQRRFFFAFGVDVVTAQTLNNSDATALADRINWKLGEMTA